MNVVLQIGNKSTLINIEKQSAYFITGKRKSFTLRISHNNESLYAKLNSDVSESGRGSDILYHTEKGRNDFQKNVTVEVKVGTEKGATMKRPTPILRIGFSTKNTSGETIGINVTLFTTGKATILLVEKVHNDFCFEEASEAFTTNSPDFLSKLKSVEILAQ